MAGELWASVFGLATMRSSLATSVPSSTGVGTTAVGLDIWNVDTQWPTFSVTILVRLSFFPPSSSFFPNAERFTSPGHQIDKFAVSTEKKSSFVPFHSHLINRFLQLGRKKNEEITFNTVVIKLLYSYSTGWRDNSSLATVRPTSTPLVLFLLSAILFLFLNKLMVFTGHSHTREGTQMCLPL